MTGCVPARFGDSLARQEMPDLGDDRNRMIKIVVVAVDEDVGMLPGCLRESLADLVASTQDSLATVTSTPTIATLERSAVLLAGKAVVTKDQDEV